MRLSAYMESKGLKDPEVADAIGRSRASVSRYRRGLERPDWRTMQAIRLWSKGKVQEADWRKLSNASQREPAEARAA